MLMLSKDMLVETPVPEAELEDRWRKPGHDGENQCSLCGVGEDGPWYDVRDIMVIRHWTTDSRLDEVGNGGHYMWYCPDHLSRRRGEWRTSGLAPAHLQPEVVYHCKQRAELGRACGEVAEELVEGTWMCARHASVERLNIRMRELLADDDKDDDSDDGENDENDA
jgi:hypothetical protein